MLDPSLSAERFFLVCKNTNRCCPAPTGARLSGQAGRLRTA